MAWEARKIVGFQTNDDGVPIMIGFINRRHCGCYGAEGMRLDNQEPTFSGSPCDEHGAQVARAIDTLQHMPPQNRAVASLFAEQLEAELQP